MNIEDIYDVTPMQAAMLLKSLTPSPRSTYLVRQVLRLSPGIDDARLEDAWRAVICRHDIFRTVFVNLESKKPQQVVLDQIHVPWAAVDLAASSQEELEWQLAGDGQPALDVERGPLMRFTLVRANLEGSDHCYLVWTYHHALLDGWSVPIVLKQVGEQYRTLDDASVPPAPQYGAYVRWLERQDTATAEAYWTGFLSGLDSPTLICGRPTENGEDGSDEGKPIRLTLPQAYAERVVRFARQEKVTVSATLQTAWAILLGLYGNRNDVTFGAVVSGRPPQLDGVERIVGPFLNTVPVRASWAVTTSARELVLEQHRQGLERQGCEYLPLTEIQKMSDLPRGDRLFDSVFVYENYPIFEGERRDDLLEAQIEQVSVNTDMPLTLSAWIQEGLHIELKYGGACSRAFASELVARFRSILDELIENPDRSIFDFDHLADDEVEHLLLLGRGSVQAALSVRCPDEAVSWHAREAPDGIAIVSGVSHVSYGALDARVERIAHQLVALEAGPEQRVGLLLPATPDFVAAMLGCLRVGCCYIPLDLSHPDQHVAQILRDSGAKILITDGASSARAATFGLRSVVEVGQAGHAELGQPGVVPPASLAYVIYTSGSTGLPKGVMVSRQDLMNYLSWAVEQLGIDAATHTAVTTSLAYDLCLTSLLPPLLAGGTVWLLPPGESLTAMGEGLSRLPNDAVVKLTPSHLRLLRTVAEEGQSFSFRVLVSGGERLLNEEASFWKRKIPDLRLINHYGPTETVVGACFHEVREAGAEGDVPIGGPLSNKHVLILTSSGRLVPRGGIGELYIGGAGVARGYLGRAGLTAERFVPDPFCGNGSRLYRTGDLARYLADGSIEFLGRADSQVKIRGFRVEPGEIEAMLERFPGVEQAAVVAREAAAGHKVLAAYVKLEGGGASVEEEIEAFLRDRLPAPMLPSSVTVLDSFPLTANGKLDRKLLPDPASAGSTGRVAPRTDEERQLVKLWQEVLGLDEIGIHDNFFELGGDSIIMIQVMARAKRLGLHLSPRQMARHQTVAELASVVSPGETAGREAFVGEAPLLPIQQRFFETDERDIDHFNQSMVFRCPRLDRELLRMAVDAVVAQHDALQSRFERMPQGSWRQLYGAVRPEGILDELDLSAVAQEHRQERVRAAFEACQRQLDIEQGRLIRGVLVRSSATEDLLLLTIHHLVVDGVSWRIILDDLEFAYGKLEAGERVRLPPKTTSPAVWARHIETLASDGAAAKELDYWLKQRSPQAGSGQPAQPAAEARIQRLSLTRQETRKLLQDVPRAYGTEINDVLITALVLALARDTGEVLLELEGHGREDIFTGVDLSQSVGWFTTAYPLLITIPPDSDPVAALSAVKQQLRNVPRRGIGYGALRYLSPDPAVRQSLAKLPTPTVSFNYLGQFGQDHSHNRRFAIQGDLIDQFANSGTTSASARRLGVTCSLLDGRLRLLSAEPLSGDRQDSLVAERVLASLRSLIEAAALETSNVLKG